jgi:hypothetical protein
MYVWQTSPLTFNASRALTSPIKAPCSNIIQVIRLSRLMTKIDSRRRVTFSRRGRQSKVYPRPNSYAERPSKPFGLSGEIGEIIIRCTQRRRSPSESASLGKMGHVYDESSQSTAWQLKCKCLEDQLEESSVGIKNMCASEHLINMQNVECHTLHTYDLGLHAVIAA